MNAPSRRQDGLAEIVDHGRRRTGLPVRSAPAGTEVRGRGRFFVSDIEVSKQWLGRPLDGEAGTR